MSRSRERRRSAPLGPTLLIERRIGEQATCCFDIDIQVASVVHRVDKIDDKKDTGQDNGQVHCHCPRSMA